MKDIEIILPGLTTNGTEFIYITSTRETEGSQALEADLANIHFYRQKTISQTKSQSVSVVIMLPLIKKLRSFPRSF